MLSVLKERGKDLKKVYKKGWRKRDEK